MLEITSPPKVPGPPPHYHKGEREFFMVLKGKLDVMADGAWQTLGPGSFVELAPGTVHSFVNNGDEDAVWITFHPTQQTDLDAIERELIAESYDDQALVEYRKQLEGGAR